jgi:hypothetical protein
MVYTHVNKISDDNASKHVDATSKHVDDATSKHVDDATSKCVDDDSSCNVYFYIGDYIILSFALWIIGAYLLYLFIDVSSFEFFIKTALFSIFTLFNILYTFHLLTVKHCEIIIFFIDIV